jgi:hypothetical protein
MGNILNRKKVEKVEKKVKKFYRPYKPTYIKQPVVKYNGKIIKTNYSFIYNGVKGGII